MRVIKVVDGSSPEFVDANDGATVGGFASSQGISNYTASVGNRSASDDMVLQSNDVVTFVTARKTGGDTK
jgi:hypothetical protein